MTSTGPSPGLSVVCVFNDLDVRQRCLDASIDAHGAGVDLEFLPVDNVRHAFSSAGAALNHGARLATKDVVVFVHQDVYLHSPARIAEVATHLMQGTWSTIGAAGITRGGESVGTMRDRVQIIGAPAPSPVEVDSLDEVLFMVRRDRVLEHPLSEAPELAWHAYAIEYSVRHRARGLRAGAADLAITHNSLTINLDRLDVAHAHVAKMYPAQTPVRTTCGVVGAAPRLVDGPRLVREQRWRKRWLGESLRARRAQRLLGERATVLADIRLDVDGLHWPEDQVFQVVNLDPGGRFADHAAPGVRLLRYGRPFEFSCVRTVEAALATLAAHEAAPTLLTNLTFADLEILAGSSWWAGQDTVLGIHDDDIWLLAGSVVSHVPRAWTSRRAVPLAPRR